VRYVASPAAATPRRPSPDNKKIIEKKSNAAFNQTFIAKRRYVDTIPTGCFCGRLACRLACRFAEAAMPRERAKTVTAVYSVLHNKNTRFREF